MFNQSVPTISRAEVITVLIVFTLLGLLAYAQILNGSRRLTCCRMTCVNNLKQVGLACRIFATDHQDRFPPHLSTNQGGTREFVGLGKPYVHFQVLSNELGTPKILTCPMDDRKPATNFVNLQNEQVSYFIGIDSDETKPQMFFAGDRNLTNGFPPANAIVSLRTNANVRWTQGPHGRMGNVGLANGAAHRIESDMKLRQFLSQTGNASNRVALPLAE